MKQPGAEKLLYDLTIEMPKIETTEGENELDEFWK
jgi:hypothetical protein